MAGIPAAIRELHDVTYPALLQRLSTSSPNSRLVLAIQYRPSLQEQDLGVYTALSALPAIGGAPATASPQAKLEALLEAVYAPILDMARKLSLPVVDLARSLDPRNNSLFQHQIEPSREGGAVIARLIMHAATHHNAAAMGSVLYYLPCDGRSRERVVAERNAFTPANPWRVAGTGGVPEGAPFAEPTAQQGGVQAARAPSAAAAGGGGGGGSSSSSSSSSSTAVSASEAEANAIGAELFAGVEAFPGPDIIISDATDFNVIVPATGPLPAVAAAQAATSVSAGGRQGGSAGGSSAGPAAAAAAAGSAGAGAMAEEDAAVAAGGTGVPTSAASMGVSQPDLTESPLMSVQDSEGGSIPFDRAALARMPLPQSRGGGPSQGGGSSSSAAAATAAADADSAVAPTASSSGAGAFAPPSLPTLPPPPVIGALLHGNICAARDSAVLAAHNIRLIVQCAGEFSAGKPGAPTPREGVRVLDLNLSDTTTQRLGDAVAAALPLMAAVRAAGGGVLVNCMAGISRSTSVVLAHLMDYTQVDLRTAWVQVRTERPKACPNLGFAIQLMSMEAARRGGRSSIPPAALRASPLYPYVFESDSEGQRFIADALRNAQ